MRKNRISVNGHGGIGLLKLIVSIELYLEDLEVYEGIEIEDAFDYGNDRIEIVFEGIELEYSPEDIEGILTAIHVAKKLGIITEAQERYIKKPPKFGRMHFKYRGKIPELDRQFGDGKYFGKWEEFNQATKDLDEKEESNV